MVAADAARPLYAFAIPASLARQTGVTKVRMIELKSSEELMATKRAQASGGNLNLAIELVKESLRYVGTSRVSTGDGSVDTWWAKADPGFSKIRQLLMAAYMQLHNPSQDESEDFLSSVAVEIK